MQIRSKTYLHFLLLRRLLRDAIPPRHGDVSTEASPLLIYIAVVLVFLLAILEVDAHRGTLESLGFLAQDYSIPAVFVSP
jgi:hypothetical protein